MHRHTREDELFYVLEGRYEVYDGTGWSPLAAGAPHFAPRGVFHTFRNVGTTHGRLLVVSTPGGLDEYFAELQSLDLPQDQLGLDEVNRMYGIEYKPPPDGPPA